ncbi:MAG: hypothetical protein LBF62_04280 [Tannerellaceae bacterium]|nr:hypothetical protein [Tannerellaceae bacterium]
MGFFAFFKNKDDFPGQLGL